MNIKRQLIKRLNLSKLFWPHLSNGLYCFNFHRIGKWQETDFDPCVFSCDEENFRRYMIFLKKHFRIVSLEELTAIIESNKPVTEKLALITFDDGYADNYHLAYPILKSLQLSATFFITTSLVDSDITPWWDEIAWHVKHCAGKSICLNDWSQAIKIDKLVSKQNIRSVLQRVKSTPAAIDSQLQQLKEISKSPIPDESRKNMFISWQQLIEMSENNMSVGTHSHTHKVFTCLTEDELNFELEESKRLIELNLAKSIDSLSYPVGSPSTYSHTMFNRISSKGYKLAFSFRGVINRKPSDNRFELGRLSIDQPFNERIFKEMILSAKSK